MDDEGPEVAEIAPRGQTMSEASVGTVQDSRARLNAIVASEARPTDKGNETVHARPDTTHNASRSIEVPRPSLD